MNGNHTGNEQKLNRNPTGMKQKSYKISIEMLDDISCIEIPHVVQSDIKEYFKSIITMESEIIRKGENDSYLISF